MEGKVSCCGVICPECGYYPGECAGCEAIEGNVFWLQYTGGEICDIYDCCRNRKGLAHCGTCGELPCGRYSQQDPTITPEENEAGFKKQMERLAELKKREAGDQ